MKKRDLISFAISGIMVRIKREEGLAAKGNKDASVRLEELKKQYTELLELSNRKDLEEGV